MLECCITRCCRDSGGEGEREEGPAELVLLLSLWYSSISIHDDEHKDRVVVVGVVLGAATVAVDLADLSKGDVLRRELCTTSAIAACSCS